MLFNTYYRIHNNNILYTEQRFKPFCYLKYLLISFLFFLLFQYAMDLQIVQKSKMMSATEKVKSVAGSVITKTRVTLAVSDLRRRNYCRILSFVIPLMIPTVSASVKEMMKMMMITMTAMTMCDDDDDDEERYDEEDDDENDADDVDYYGDNESDDNNDDDYSDDCDDDGCEDDDDGDHDDDDDDY